MNYYIKNPYLVGLAAGGALGIGFIFPAVWFLGLFGIGALWWIADQNFTKKQVCSSFILAWFLKYFCSLAWYTSLYPLTWVDIKSPFIQILSVGFYWVTCAVWLTFGGIIWYAVARILRTVRPELKIPLLALGWLGAELGASLAFSIATYGSGGTLTTAFSFGMVGYLMGATTLGVFLAAVGGVYGLSFLVVYTVGVVYTLQKDIRNRRMVVGVGFPYFVYLLLVMYASATVSSNPLQQTVLTINTHFTAAMHSTQEGNEYKKNALTQAVAAAHSVAADAIILPEDSRYFLMAGDGVSYESGIRQYRFGVGSSTSIFLDTGRTMTETGAVLRAYEYDPVRSQVTNTDKQYLVPQGEFMPWFYATVYTVLGYGDLVKELKNSGYHTGTSGVTAIPVMFCFESVDPHAAKRVKTNATSFIAHPLSHAWFNSPHGLWQQLDIMLRLQARAANVSIISAANLASGKRYTPQGTIDEGELIASGEGWEVRRYQAETN